MTTGCGGSNSGTDTDTGGLPGLEAIDVSPETSDLLIADFAVAQTVSLIATGHFEGGKTRDITAEVTWGVDNDAPGTIVAPGKWQASNLAGGKITVEARSGKIAGNATISVFLAPVIEDPSAPLPPGTGNPVDLFDPAKPVVVGQPDSPRIVYPANETMFPINVYRILFQHDITAQANLYRIRFKSDFLDMQVFTTADRWLADETTWSFLARTNAGSKVTMTVTGVNTASPATLYQSQTIDVYFSPSTVEGAIYYWSTSSEGVMKGVLSEPAPTKFYTVAPDNTCVACHTISRDGTRLAGGYNGETLQEVTIPDREVLVPATRDYGMGWSTFSPDGTRLLLADRGQLRLINADTGDPIGANNGIIDLGGQLATHPDWSPLGDFVAVALCPTVGNKDVSVCSIGRIPVKDDVFATPEVLVPTAGGSDNNFFPRYSPDGQWIAYVHAAGKSKDQPLSELMLIPATGLAQGQSPTVLTRANRRVGPNDGVPSTGSTMPTWAPSTHPGTQWLAFSSIRDYGKVLVGDKADQLWVVAIDLARTQPGQDPSFAAFWLPLQDPAQRNHRAFWALDAEKPCNGTVEVCDGFDNDCDGVVDESCTTCGPAEVCGNGVDDDCDGSIDDGCIIVK